MTTGRLMKAADFRAKVVFDMEKEDDSFHFTGHVGAVQLEAAESLACTYSLFKSK